MQKEQMNLPEAFAQQISAMLQKDGLATSEINEILNGEYCSCNTKEDLLEIFGSEGNHQNVLQCLAEGYSMDELEQQGVKPKEIEAFTSDLEQKGITVENAKGFYQYSGGSNMILAIKKGTADKTTIAKHIEEELSESLGKRGVPEEQILNIQEQIRTLDLNRPLHENYDAIKSMLREMNIPEICDPSVCNSVKYKNSLQHIEDTLANVDDALAETRLPQSMVLYRAIKTDGTRSLEDYIGKGIDNRGYTSTSPLYDTSFARYPKYDTVMKIYAPKGTQGIDITKYSIYDSAESETMLNPNKFYIFDAQEGVIDKNGNSKTVLTGLLLSDERECYRGISKEEKVEHIQEDISQGYAEGSNLPAKQPGRLLRYYYAIAARFKQPGRRAVQNTSNISRDEHGENQKKPWELGTEQKAEIVKRTDEISRRYAEQQEMDATQEQEISQGEEAMQHVETTAQEQEIAQGEETMQQVEAAAQEQNVTQAEETVQQEGNVMPEQGNQPAEQPAQPEQPAEQPIQNVEGMER